MAFFVLLGYLAHQAYIFPGDLAISSWLRAAGGPVFHASMVVLSFLGDAVPAGIIVSLSIILLVIFRRRLEALFIVSVTVSGTLLGQLLKWLIDRPRPEGLDGLSFPSGHTLYAAAFYGSLFCVAPRLVGAKPAVVLLRLGLALLVLFTGAARVHLGAHWPSDVLGSFVLGGLLLVPAFILYRRHMLRRT